MRLGADADRRLPLYREVVRRSAGVDVGLSRRVEAR
jgi:hypothetical protein